MKGVGTTETAIGWRDVFFTRRRVPLLEYFHSRKYVARGIAAMGAVVGWTLVYLVSIPYSQGRQTIRANDVWGFTALAWLFGEPIFAALDIRHGAMAARRWREEGRLPEMVLTGLRPLTISQLMLGRALGEHTRFVVWLYIGLCAGIVWFRAEVVWAVVPFGLVALNALVNVHVFGWVSLALQLAYDRLRAAGAMVLFLVVCVLLQAPLYMLIGVFAAMIQAMRIRGQLDEALIIVFFHVAAAVYAHFKYLFARAYAARLEDAIFPEMEL